MKTKFNPTKSLKSMSFLWLCPWTPICFFYISARQKFLMGLLHVLNLQPLKIANNRFTFKATPRPPSLNLHPSNFKSLNLP